MGAIKVIAGDKSNGSENSSSSKSTTDKALCGDPPLINETPIPQRSKPASIEGYAEVQAAPT